MGLELMPPLLQTTTPAPGQLFSFHWRGGSHALPITFPLFEVPDNCV